MLALPQGHHMMIDAAGPQIADALVTRHEIKPPDGRIEPLRPADIRRFEIDAAQCRDWKMGHCERRFPNPCTPFLQYRNALVAVISLASKIIPIENRPAN